MNAERSEQPALESGDYSPLRPVVCDQGRQTTGLNFYSNTQKGGAACITVQTVIG